MTPFSPSYVFLALKKQVQITTELETPKEAKATQQQKKLIIAKHGEKLQLWHLQAIINSLAGFIAPSGPHVN